MKLLTYIYEFSLTEKGRKIEPELIPLVIVEAERPQEAWSLLEDLISSVTNETKSKHLVDKDIYACNDYRGSKYKVIGKERVIYPDQNDF